MSTGVISMGIKCPLIKSGDDLKRIVIDSVLSSSELNDQDVIGITESVVARSQGNYVTINEIADRIRHDLGEPRVITVSNFIYSRNRFALILKAIARAAGSDVVLYMPDYDEVGNVAVNHPFTKMNYIDYYREIINKEGKGALIFTHENTFSNKDINTIYCGLHNYDAIKAAFPNIFTLKDFFTEKCEYGLLGSNKATDDMLKLFPNTDLAKKLCKDIQDEIYEATGKYVIVCIYGDGCFKDPIGGIWEFADPVTMPAYTDEPLLESSPNEVKLKALIDEGNSFNEIKDIILNKDRDLRGNMLSQGTTPRRYRDLLASLMDLTSGSGDKGTPIVLIKNYFNNYSNA